MQPPDPGATAEAPGGQQSAPSDRFPVLNTDCSMFRVMRRLTESSTTVGWGWPAAPPPGRRRAGRGSRGRGLRSPPFPQSSSHTKSAQHSTVHTDSNVGLQVCANQRCLSAGYSRAASRVTSRTASRAATPLQSLRRASTSAAHLGETAPTKDSVSSHHTDHIIHLFNLGCIPIPSLEC